MESKYIVSAIAIVSVIAVILSGVALGVTLTKETPTSDLDQVKYTVFIGTNAETEEEAYQTLIDVTLASTQKFDNGYSAFVVTGSTFEGEKGQVMNTYSIAIIYGMVTDEKALNNFLDWIKENMSDRTDVILTEKSYASYDLYIPPEAITYSV